MRDQNIEAGRLQVRTGAEPPDPAEAGSTAAREAELRTALDGIRTIRRLTNSGPDPAAHPAAWERGRLLHTVSLLLEAEGIAPSATGADGEPVRTGYRTSEGERPGQVLVRWVGPRGSGARYQEQEHLRRCQDVLRDWGFEALAVRGPGRRHHVEVEAGRDGKAAQGPGAGG
ncbi:hypothetical protein [Streptomyces lydicus]|uniref:hypothetical protein n=1 Tax=Streptomyces lydicus TaxID=47763 RepID=UPI0007C44514|nr:hypothetical protein [Streptomyces lydicus]MDC7341219.1 hypothetical protein [Streptomyces lydicus]UEG89108.1 hypothetical protein LJ741_00260 [Streptomyces lydicus]